MSDFLKNAENPEKFDNFSKEGYEMELVERPSPWPYYAAGCAFVIYALLFPLYRMADFALSAALTVAVFFTSRRFVFKPAKIWVKAKEERILTGDKDADALIAEGRGQLRRLRVSRGEIENAGVREKLDKIIAALEAIFAHIGENPAKAVRIRMLMDYYLPTVVKLSEKYAELESQKIRGENIRESLEGVEGILGTVEKAFEKLLDALFGDTALDISTDVKVLESMLAGEGLSGGIAGERADK